MKEQQFIKLLCDIKDQIIKKESLYVEVRNCNGDIIGEDETEKAEPIETIEINDERVVQLLTSLNHNPYITKLYLNYNIISDEGAIALSQLNTLKQVYLQGNPIGLKGATVLANSKLETLIFGANSFNIGSNNNRAFVFFDALINNHTIKQLSLSECFNDNFADKLIDKLIRENNSITQLQLDSNSLSDISLQSIHLNCTIQVISIAENNITDIGVTYLLKNNTLKCIDLIDNNITKKGMQLFIGSQFDKVKACYRGQSYKEIKQFQSAFSKVKKILFDQQKQQ